jgi:tRNA-dihydrouridine synthase
MLDAGIKTKLIPAIGLAPMEGVTDPPLRAFIRMAGAPDFASTPFLRVTKTFPGKEIPRAFAPELPRIPLTIQLMAASAEDFCRAAEAVFQDTKSVELNCGCPVDRVVGHGAGSSLLEHADQFRATLVAITKQFDPGTVAVKMRTGFDSAAEFPALLAALKDIPLKRLTVHGRTRVQKYSGEADWSLIRQAAQTLPYPVIGSGDIIDAASLKARLDAAPEVSGVVIGRGVMRNPWIFAMLRGDASHELSPRALVFALAVCAALHQLPTALELEDKEIGTNCDGWENAWLTIATAHNLDHDPFRLEVDRRTLGRMKQLWLHLRLSLLPELMDVSIPRAGTFGDFIHRIQQCAGESENVFQMWTVFKGTRT